MATIYLDFGGAHPLHPAVKAALADLLEEPPANPQSPHHLGVDARKRVERAREQVAGLLHADPEEITCTSGGTEANSLAIRGLAQAHERKGTHIILSAIEHVSVMYPAMNLRKEGYTVTQVPVATDGTIDLEALRDSITDESSVLSVQYANPEIGTVQPVEKLAAIAHENGMVFHCDAVDASATWPIDVSSGMFDAVSLGAPAWGGPVGAGALYVKRGVRVRPQMLGGSQEEGRRAGGENIYGIIGMGVAAEQLAQEGAGAEEHMTPMRDTIIDRCTADIPDCELTGARDARLPYHASFVLKDIEGEALVLTLEENGIIASSGSVCSLQSLKDSHVLTAIGCSKEYIRGAVILTVGPATTQEQVDTALGLIPEAVEEVRML